MRGNPENFSILMNEGQDQSKEIRLESIPKEGSQEKANQIFGRIKVTPEIKKLRTSFFDLLNKGLREAAIFEESKKNKNDNKNEIVLTFRSTPLAELEAKLIALFAPLANTYKTEKEITEALKKFQQNYQEAEEYDKPDPEIIAEYFPTGKGLFSALECYRVRKKAPLPENHFREIFLQANLDAKADTDFIEVNYYITDKGVSISELNFIQVKSSFVVASKLAGIQRKHEALANEMASNIEVAQKKFYPEISFENEGDIDDKLIDLGIELDELKTQPNGHINVIDSINKIFKSNLEENRTGNLSTNAPIRLEAQTLCKFVEAMELIDSEEAWLGLFQDMLKRYKEYKPFKCAQSIKEIQRVIKSQTEPSQKFTSLIEKLILELPPEHIDALEHVMLPQVIPVERIRSITTIGAKEVVNGGKVLSPDKKRLMVTRLAA